MKLKLTNVRLSFPALFEPEQYDAKSKPRWSGTFLVPAGSPLSKEVDKALLGVATAKWGAKGPLFLKSILGDPKGCCWQDGNLKTSAGYENMFALTAHRYESDGAPLVLDTNKSPLTAKDGRPYAGCYVNATVDLWPQDNANGRGIRAQLLGVQFVKDGDAFGASKPPEVDDFEDLSEGSDATDLA